MFIEKLNKKSIEKLYFMGIEKLRDLIFFGQTDSEKKNNMYDYSYQSEYNKIRKLYDIMIKSNNTDDYFENKVEYNNSKNDKRLFCTSISLQNLPRNIRSVLSYDTLFDIDIENAQPSIILQECKKNNIECYELERYCKKRTEYLKNIMDIKKISRGEAKKIIIILFNSETNTLCSKLSKDKDISKLNQEIKNIQTELFNKFGKNYKIENNKNIKGSFMSRFYHEKENEYVNESIQYLKKQNINTSTIIFDGFMIFKGKYDLDIIINSLNSKFKSRGIKFSNKSFDEDVVKFFSDITYEKKDLCLCESIPKLADYLLNNIFKDRLVKSKGFFYYMSNNLIISDKLTIEMDLYKFISSQDYNLIGNEMDQVISISNDHDKIKKLVESLIFKCPTDDSFLKNVHDYTKHKLFFNNGYYDFNTKKFIIGTHNKTFVKINKNYSPKRNNEMKKVIYEKILNPIFTITGEKNERNELLTYFLHRISNFIAGNIEQKKWMLLEGLRNSGKGVLCTLLSNTFDEYVTTTNAENFLIKKNINDASKSNSWIVRIKSRRIVFTNEVIISEPISGIMIKKFCSGGDPIEARVNNKDEIEFNIQCSLIMCCNDFPETNPKDALDTCEPFYMRSTFDKNIDTCKRLEGFTYYKANDNIKELLLNEDLQMEFINIIFDAYNKNCEYPNKLSNENKENDEGNDDYTKILDRFEIVNDDKLFLSNNEIQQIINESKVPFTLKKVKDLLRSKGAKIHTTGKARGLKCIKIVEDYE